MAGRKIFLVVEDDADVRHSITRALQRAGFECAEADSAEAGLVIAMTDDICGAVIDLCLPGMSGGELSWRLTQEAPGLPVIAVSGDLGMWDSDDLRQLGVKRSFGMPFPARGFAAAARELVDQRVPVAARGGAGPYVM